jgi:hypothetical protein
MLTTGYTAIGIRDTGEVIFIKLEIGNFNDNLSQIIEPLHLCPWKEDNFAAPFVIPKISP